MKNSLMSGFRLKPKVDFEIENRNILTEFEHPMNGISTTRLISLMITLRPKQYRDINLTFFILIFWTSKKLPNIS